MSLGAPELALKVGEGIDNVPRFECSVAATNGDLRQDVRIHEPVDRFIGLNRAAANKCSRALDRDDGSTDKLAEQEIGLGTCSDLAQPTAPISAQSSEPAVRTLQRRSLPGCTHRQSDPPRG